MRTCDAGKFVESITIWPTMSRSSPLLGEVEASVEGVSECLMLAGIMGGAARAGDASKLVGSESIAIWLMMVRSSPLLCEVESSVRGISEFSISVGVTAGAARAGEAAKIVALGQAFWLI